MLHAQYISSRDLNKLDHDVYMILIVYVHQLTSVAFRNLDVAMELLSNKTVNNIINDLYIRSHYLL